MQKIVLTVPDDGAGQVPVASFEPSVPDYILEELLEYLGYVVDVVRNPPPAPNPVQASRVDRRYR